MQLLPADLWKGMMRFVAHDSLYEFAGFAIRMRLIEYFKQDIDVKIHAQKILDEYCAHHCMTHEKKGHDTGFDYLAWGPPYF